MSEEKPIVVHVYYMQGDVSEYNYTSAGLAKDFARVCFKNAEVYKVKVWDLRRGEIERNSPNAEALILELV